MKNWAAVEPSSTVDKLEQITTLTGDLIILVEFYKVKSYSK